MRAEFPTGSNHEEQEEEKLRNIFVYFVLFVVILSRARLGATVDRDALIALDGRGRAIEEKIEDDNGIAQANRSIPIQIEQLTVRRMGRLAVTAGQWRCVPEKNTAEQGKRIRDMELSVLVAVTRPLATITADAIQPQLIPTGHLREDRPN